MKIFHCGQCDQLVFFENTACVHCGSKLAYLPDREVLGALVPAGDGLYREVSPGAGDAHTYRLCINQVEHGVCNWAVASDDPNPYCRSCRLTRVLPHLSRPGARDLWGRMENAKRRLLHSLIALKLPIVSKRESPATGLAFAFLADPPPGSGLPKVLTGHEDGLITINIAEADDAERERRRHQMHEPYRTLLGHFRHEVGHYYWDILLKNSPRIDEFRSLFGDEREDYAQALERHHKNGAPPNWAATFVSAYASSHPWEDWAETWAHYLHLTDTLETAVACGVSLRPNRSGEPALNFEPPPAGFEVPSFDTMIERWFPLTYVLNNLNRGMGLQDGYPFVLTSPSIRKLRFVHQVIHPASRTTETPRPPQNTEDFQRLSSATS